MSTRSGRKRVIAPEESPSRTQNSDKSWKRSKSARLRFRKSPSPTPPSRKSATDFPIRKSPSRTSKENAENATSKSPAGHPPIKSEPRVVLYDIRQTPYFIKDLSSSVTQSKIPIESKLRSIHTFHGGDNSDEESHDVTYNVPESRSCHSRSASKSISGPIHTFHGGDNSDGESHDVTYNVLESRSCHSRSASKSISGSILTFHDGDNSDGELQREPSRSHTLITSFKESINNVLFNKWFFGKRLGCTTLMFLISLTFGKRLRSITLMLLISLKVFAILISCTKLF